jgi:hypothetical protein
MCSPVVAANAYGDYGAYTKLLTKVFSLHAAAASRQLQKVLYRHLCSQWTKNMAANRRSQFTVINRNVTRFNPNLQYSTRDIEKQ